jgi:hypothetical protein
MITETGVVQSGSIILDHPLAIPDGVRVRLSVEELSQAVAGANQLSDVEFRSLPFFGDWADRTDLGTSADYVREERAKWSQRLGRPG